MLRLNSQIYTIDRFFAFFICFTLMVFEKRRNGKEKGDFKKQQKKIYIHEYDVSIYLLKLTLLKRQKENEEKGKRREKGGDGGKNW